LGYPHEPLPEIRWHFHFCRIGFFQPLRSVPLPFDFFPAFQAVHQVDFCPMHGQGRKFPIRIGGNSLGVQVIGGSKISHYGGYFDEH